MKKTFQQIHDFCLNDPIYNVYYNIPDSLKCKSRNQYLYYYGTLIKKRGISRAGTILYGAARKQIKDFLRGQKEDHYVHVNQQTFEIIDYQNFEGKTIYIRAHMGKHGVYIEYDHPYRCSHNEDTLIWFTPRSHLPFNEVGIALEAKKHFYKHHLFPAGRYRDLQLKYEIPKERFVEWYKTDYRIRLEHENDTEHWEMVNKYLPVDSRPSWEDCYDLLSASGAFYDFNADEYEKDEMTDMLYHMF